VTTTSNTESPQMGPDNHLWALGMQLGGCGYTVEQYTQGELVVRNPSADDASAAGAEDRITCCPREEDGGRYWFFASSKEPLAEADHYTDALVAIKGRLGVPR
jgi:hypothetical protein